MFDQNDLMLTSATDSNFQFSGISVDRLQASEYTLVVVAMDQSGSVVSYQAEQIKALEAIIEACRKSPRAENLLVRLITFNDKTNEEHGFKPLSSIDASDYKSIASPNGMTALFDGTVNAIESIKSYGRRLMEDDFDVNAITFIITDGEDNRSRTSAQDVKKALNSCVTEETVESIRSILIGVNTSNPLVAKALDSFHKESGIDQYIKIDDASGSALAKMADFVSKSISAQSLSLGSGGPSKALSF